MASCVWDNDFEGYLTYHFTFRRDGSIEVGLSGGETQQDCLSEKGTEYTLKGTFEVGKEVETASGLMARALDLKLSITDLSQGSEDFTVYTIYYITRDGYLLLGENGGDTERATDLDFNVKLKRIGQS